MFKVLDSWGSWRQYQTKEIMIGVRELADKQMRTGVEFVCILINVPCKSLYINLILHNTEMLVITTGVKCPPKKSFLCCGVISDCTEWVVPTRCIYFMLVQVLLINYWINARRSTNHSPDYLGRNVLLYITIHCSKLWLPFYSLLTS